MWVPCSLALLHQEDPQVEVEEEQFFRQVLGEQEVGEGVIPSRDVVPLDQEGEVAVLQGLEEEVEDEEEDEEVT